MAKIRPLALSCLAATVWLLAPGSASAQLGVTALDPPSGAGGICRDTPLRITFDAVPS